MASRPREVQLYKPNLATPDDVRALRFWLHNELSRIASGLLQHDIRVLDFLTDDVTGVFTDWMHWAGYWVPGYYRLNDVVLDDDWTMVVVNPDGTTERAAPQPVGDPEQGYPVDNFSTQNNPGWTLTANRFTFSKDGWIDAFRVRLPSADTDYEYHAFLIRNAGLPNEVVEQFYTIPTTAYVEDWIDIPIGDPIALSGDVWEVGLIALNNAAPVYHVDGRWQYAGSSQNGDPYYGGWNHNNQHNTIRFHEQQAEGLGAAPELADLGADDIVTISTGSAQWRYSLTGPATFANQVYTFTGVTRIEATGSITSGAICDVEGGNISGVPTDYVLESNYWASTLPSFASNVDGVFQTTQAAIKALDNNAYGADLTFQEGAVSDDWEVVSGPSTGAGGGGGSDQDTIGLPAYGSLHLQAPAGPGVPISNITTMRVAMDTINVAVPLRISYDLPNDAMIIEEAGVYQVDLYVQAFHEASGAIRIVDYGLYDEALGAYLTPSTLMITNANETLTEGAASITIDIPGSSVGNPLTLRVGGRGTSGFTSWQPERGGFSLARIDNKSLTPPPPGSENAYDDFLRSAIAPRLWIQGYLGVTNSGTAGPITPTGYFVGEEDFSPISPSGAKTGAGSNIDPSAGGIKQLFADDFSKWLDQGRGYTTLTIVGDNEVEVRLDGAVNNTPAFGFLQILSGNRPARGGWEYNYVVSADDSYDMTAPPEGIANIRLQNGSVDVFNVPSTIAPDNLPTGLSGVDVHPVGVTAFYAFDTGYQPAYDNNAAAPTWYESRVKVEGHGGGCWTWPENTFVGDSDYSLGIIYDWIGVRFGLNAAAIQTIHQASDCWWYFDNGTLKVEHGGNTYTLGALTGHIVITFNKTTQELKGYQDGILQVTVPAVAIPSATPWSVEGFGARTTFNTGYQPLADESQHLWTVDKELTPQQVSDLFNSVP